MKAVVQRVSEASVMVAGEIVGKIGRGLVALVAVTKVDEAKDVEWMARKLVGLRVFPEGEKAYEKDVKEVGGSLLLVSNFTVTAETADGRRPSLIAAAGGDKAKPMFDDLVAKVRSLGVQTETGRFGAEMKVTIVNDGPLTLIVDSRG